MRPNILTTMLKNNRNNITILKAVKSTNSHPSADWIYDGVRKELPKISLGTVYRHLRQLEEEGQLRGIHIDGKSSRFDCNTENHCHFSCKKCEQVFDLIVPECSDIIDKLTHDRGLYIESYMVLFRGLCVECQKSVK